MAAPSLARTEAQCAIAAKLARRLRESRHELAKAWVDSIMSHDASQPPRPPSGEMVDDMPLLIDGIAWHLEHPDERLGIDSPVIQKAMQIGTLRHAQGFTTRDILEEYELLGHVLFDCLAGVVEEANVDGGNPMLCGSLLFHAIVVIEITTTTHYFELAAKRVAEREERLHAFNRAVSHEIKNRLGTIVNAGQMLTEKPELSGDELHQFADIIARNAHAMNATVNNLLVLARVEDNPDEHPRVPLRRAVENVVAQVAPVAQAAHVDLRVDELLPDVEVDDAVVELSLANYVRNAITYADSAASRRVVAIHACVEQHGTEPELVINVADNGLGVPVEKRDHLFERFFRAHESTHKEGTGLGLSIVQASVKAIGGRAWAEFPEKGSRFSFAVPLTRRRSRRKFVRGPEH